MPASWSCAKGLPASTASCCRRSPTSNTRSFEWSHGYSEWQGRLAEPSRAAQKLGEAGMETSTLQKHLVRGQEPDTSEKRLYVLNVHAPETTGK
jgi:hypothetical protein